MALLRMVVGTAVVTAALLGGAARAGLIGYQQLIQFQTQNQPYSLGASDVTLTFPLYENMVSRSFGQIGQVTIPTVSVETLQAAWEAGIDRCTAQSFAGIHPTRSQCINGATITYPSGVKYCNVLGVSVPCGTKTSQVVIPGAPPYPTQPVSGTFDAGAEVRLTSATSIGAELRLVEDPGRVNVKYGADVTVEASSTADPEVFQIRANGQVNEANTSIESNYREKTSATINLIAQSTTTVDLKACVPPDPCTTQHETAGLTDSGSAPLRQEFLQFSADESATGIPGAFPDYTLTILDTATFEFGLSDLETAGLIDLNAFEFEVTWPVPGGPKVKGLPRFGAGLPVGDFGLYNADYDMTEDFSCAAFATTGCLDQAYVDADGTYHRSREPLPRTSFQGPGQQESIVVDTDYLRLDADLDFILTGGIGLGIQVGIPLAATVLVDAADVDLATFWGRSQDFSFRPATMVTYEFSEPTLVEVNGQFVLLNSYAVPLGAALNIRSPSPMLVVTPVYSIADNTFHNLTQNYVDFAIEERLLGASLNGFLFEALDVANDYAALAVSLGFGNVKTGTLIDDSFALQGFDEFRGTAIAFADLVGEGDGGGTGDGGNTVPEPGTHVLVLLGLLGLIASRSRLADRTVGPSVMKAMIRIAAPQRRQRSGKTS